MNGSTMRLSETSARKFQLEEPKMYSANQTESQLH
jgi:hypothetical protein